MREPLYIKKLPIAQKINYYNKIALNNSVKENRDYAKKRLKQIFISKQYHNYHINVVIPREKKEYELYKKNQ